MPNFRRFWDNPFLQLTGNPFLGTKLLGFSIGRGSGALKRLRSPVIQNAFQTKSDTSRSTVAPPNFSSTESLGFKTSPRPYLRKYGAPWCHPDVIGRQSFHEQENARKYYFNLISKIASFLVLSSRETLVKEHRRFFLGGLSW